MARTKNTVLPRLQEQFENELNRGVLLELEPGQLDAMIEEALAAADS